MRVRTLYLQNAPAPSAPDELAGGRLHDIFRSWSSECLAGFRVRPDEAAAVSREPGRETILEESIRKFNPGVIYIEGGLFADNRGTWKIEWPVLECLVECGAVAIVADCGRRELSRHRSAYNQAARFLRTRAEIPGANSGADMVQSLPQDGCVSCGAETMQVAEWLRPAFSGISQIVVGNPVRLDSWEGIAASMPATARDGYGARNSDEAIDVFASVAQCGFGFVVFIGAEISANAWIERCPSNARWLTNLAELLVREVEHGKMRSASPVPLPFAMFLSHRSVNKQLAVRVGEALRNFDTRVWIDAEHPLPIDSLIQETSRRLEKMTHFVVFWSRACLGAPWVERELPLAVSMAVERRLPVLVVRLDMTPVPKAIADAFRLEGLGKSPQEIAAGLIGAARRIRRNNA